MNRGLISRIWRLLAVLPIALATSAEELPGWNGDFVASTNEATRSQKPLVLFWANSGCEHCKELEAAVQTDAEFLAWKASKDYVFCFHQGKDKKDQDGGTAIKDFARTAGGTIPVSEALKSYPFLCFWWPRGDGSVSATAVSTTVPSYVMGTAEETFAGYVPKATYRFAPGDTECDRYEAEPGRTSHVDVELQRSRADGDATSFAFVYQCPGEAARSETFTWGQELRRTFRVELPAHYTAEVCGQAVALHVRDSAGRAVADGRIHFVVKENGPANPYWLGEKPELEAGDWSMDLDAVTNAVKAGRADYAIAFFTGALWCPHCQGIEDFVFTTAAGRKWAKDNRVVFAVMDNPKRSADANPTKPNGAPPTLLRTEAGTNSYRPDVPCSGAGYLSRKGLVAGTETEAVLQRNHTLGYPGGYFCAPESTRTGYPTFILLDNENFRPAARFVRSEEDRSATPGTLKGNYKYYHDTDDHIQRLNDFLKLRDGGGELDSYVSTTPLSYAIGAVANVEMQLNDRYRAFVLTGLVESGTLTLRASNGRGRSVTLDYYADGELVDSATDLIEVKVRRGDLGKRLVVRINGYPNTAVKLGESSVYDVTLTSSFEPSQIVDSAALPLRFEANVCLEVLDQDGVRSVKVSKKGSLPSGLTIKYDKAAGAIVLTGKPTKAKTAVVTYAYTLTYADGSRVTSEPVEVTVSTFDPVERNPYLGGKLSRTVPIIAGDRLVGLLSVSATTARKITAKFTGDGKISFSGCWQALDGDGTASATLTKRDASLDLSLDSEGRLEAHLSNVGEAAELSGASEALVDTSAFAGRYSVVLANENASGVNFGHGSLQLAMTSASKIKTGTVSYAGVMPDGTKVSGTSQLCADGWQTYEGGATYACAVLPIYKKTSKYEVALLLRIRERGNETYGDESKTLSHVIGASDRGGCAWNRLPLVPFGSWFLANVALSGWQDVYEHVPSVFDLKLGGVKVATVMASGSKVVLTDRPDDASVSMSYTKSSGKLNGKIRLKLADGSKFSGSWVGALLPGWHYSCGGCGDDDGIVLPFGMGTCYFTDKSAGKSVNASIPVTLEISR